MTMTIELPTLGKTFKTKGTTPSWFHFRSCRTRPGMNLRDMMGEVPLDLGLLKKFLELNPLYNAYPEELAGVLVSGGLAHATNGHIAVVQKVVGPNRYLHFDKTGVNDWTSHEVEDDTQEYQRFCRIDGLPEGHGKDHFEYPCTEYRWSTWVNANATQADLVFWVKDLLALCTTTEAYAREVKKENIIARPVLRLQGWDMGSCAVMRPFHWYAIPQLQDEISEVLVKSELRITTGLELMETGLSAKYLRAALHGLKPTDTVSMSWTSPFDPIIVTRRDALVAIMPVRV